MTSSKKKPAKKKPMTARVCVRLDDATARNIAKRAKAARATPAEYVRSLLEAQF